MTPAVYPITIRQGTSFSRTFRFYTDYAQTVFLDLTDCTVKAQVRLGWNKALNLDLDVSILPTLEGIQLTIAPEATVRLAPDTYQWDLLLVTPTGEVSKPLTGDFIVEPTQTHR